MQPYVRIVRVPYEEPHLLNLAITASNGDARGTLEIYVSPDQILDWAEQMELFPRHARAVQLWEIGSERPEDRWAYYFRMRIFTVDAAGHSAIHFRFNNNSDLPDRAISELCIQSDPSALNSLGKLLRAFAELKHEVLEWTATSGRLFESAQDDEQAFARRR